MKERNNQLDNIKGILIFLVVFGHFLYYYAINNVYSTANDILVFIYTFHMPVFIFISGYLSKDNNSANKKSLIKLGLYYLVTNTLMMLFYYFYFKSPLNLFTPYNSYWYLLSLIIWRLTIKKLDKIKCLLPISFVVALLIGYSYTITNFLALSRTIAFFPFFLMGYKLKSKTLAKLKIKQKSFKYILYLTTFILISMLYLYVQNKHLTISVLLMDPYLKNTDILYRLFIFIISLIAIALMFLIIPSKNVPLLTKIGKNSLTIYLIHRFLPYAFLYFFPVAQYHILWVGYAFIASLVTVIILGSNPIYSLVNKFFDILTSLVLKYKKYIIAFIIIVIFLVISYKLYSHFILSNNIKTVNIKHPDNDDVISISYVGDLILLKNQITSAYNKTTKKYEFEEVFKYTKPYLENADLAIGVLEGPLAGNKTNYSNSNYDDGIKLYLNYPDEFADAIKWSGIDLVTTANNHVLDQGIDGALRTLDILDNKKLLHTGSYRNQKEKDTLLMINIDGVNIAVLSYLESVNYHSITDLVKNYSDHLAIITNRNSKYFTQLKKEIEKDFKKAQANADIILVLSHMGTQFNHETNKMQELWNDLFIEMGADIILSDHAHAVQPIEYRNGTLIVNCPGNFTNSYTKYNGDATSIVNIYLNKNTKEVTSTTAKKSKFLKIFLRKENLLYLSI